MRKQHRSTILLAVLCGALLALTGSAFAQNPSDSSQSQTTQTASAKEAPARTMDEPSAAAVKPEDKSRDYVIGADDVLDVSVWKEQDLTRSVQVRPDGKISMPLIGDVQAAGMTSGQLAKSISDRLKKFLTAPQVTVILTQINSQKVYVIGEVTKPGSYPVLPGMTILQAISTAGGLTQFANSKKIFLMRNEDHTQAKYPFNYKEVLDGRKAEENLQVKAGDTIVVP